MRDRGFLETNPSGPLDRRPNEARDEVLQGDYSRTPSDRHPYVTCES
jgi:hypothetical protein